MEQETADSIAAGNTEEDWEIFRILCKADKVFIYLRVKFLHKTVSS